jgi:hypothetical protein
VRVTSPSDRAPVSKDHTAAEDLAGGVLRISKRLSIPPADLLAQLEHVADSLPAGAEDPASSLSVWDEKVLCEAGSLGYKMPPLAERASTLTTVRTAQLMTGALPAVDAAKRLKVTPGRIRQRIAGRTLLAIQTPTGWRLPRFQFTATGVLPGLGDVLGALPDDVHPLVVARFLTSPHPDLLLDGEPASPAQWLDSGGDTAQVVMLTADSHQLQ